MNPPAETPVSTGLMSAKGMSSLVYLVLLIPLALMAFNYFVM
jgi:hypothetical protein